jgi:hypothetical protein
MVVSSHYVDGWCDFHHGALTPKWVAGGDHFIKNGLSALDGPFSLCRISKNFAFLPENPCIKSLVV